jgi:hypothetical protein
MAQRRRHRPRIKRKPYEPSAPGAFARQRSARTFQELLAKLREGWQKRQLRWNDVKWGLIGMADTVREEHEIDVRMAMVPHRHLGIEFYLALIQVGVGRETITITEQFTKSFEADEPADGDDDIALSYYNCEPEV